MSIERREILGDLTISAGRGAPTHDDPVGSWYADFDAAVLYVRQLVDEGTCRWVGFGISRTPANPADGQFWVEVDGVSPARTASLKVKDGADTITLLQVTY
jgi:hypothetical protein